MTDDDDTPPTPASKTWDHLKHLLQWFGTLFGDSVQLAQTILHTRKERDDTALWLRVIETLLRRVLLIEAAALPKPIFKTRTPRPCTKRARRVIEHIAEAPQNWRVRFHLIAPESRASKRGNGAQERQLSAWPLAERLEAIMRVVENPAPHIARAARRLHRRPDLARRIAKPIKLKERWAEFSLEDSEPRAQAALPTFCNTS